MNNVLIAPMATPVYVMIERFVTCRMMIPIFGL